MAPPIILIDDPADPRVAAYRDVRERDLVGREGLFVAEGEVVLNVLARSGLCEPVSLMIARKRVAGLAPLIAQMPDEVPVYSASQEAMDAVVGFHIHRGILALGRRRAAPGAADMLAGLGEGSLVLALSGIANHDNMGGLFRNAAAFGVDAVLLDTDCCDPLYRKAIRVSVGAVLATPFATAQGDLLDALGAAGFETVALSPGGDRRLVDLRRASKTAVLLGAEGPGLAASVLARATTVAIPMATGFDSLNVATTAGIVLHHLAFAAVKT
ncbi:MAG: RNA methyltransferase [Phenylobacterium sp.]|uniref:TrmH family RNA methyltransferase n=1 Tax=Phenylobacterium sp. TaxID=1871053 RepID=UPI002731726B|nr:RNA methyltransferase [Phenylobacterium sp.]MDP2009395.1 RNA methyltransferase [Phenylobacterium sp.]MDP3633753.1 RNA methyltransferase [Phenylobacterium sp.]MDP3870483.1 RNA methyltransferase [Phenylobacterium sp.]